MKEAYHTVRYSFSSELGDIDSERYITSYTGLVYESIGESEEETLIGKVVIKLILLDLAIDEQYDFIDVFETESYTSRIGQEIMDYEEGELNEDILEFYEYEVLTSNICILQRIELLETHRRQGIGKLVVKDIYKRFASSCSMFVVQAFPIQFEPTNEKIEKTGWEEKLNLESLEEDYEKAFYQLKAFYQKIGFDHIEGYDELMFLNPALRSGLGE